MASTLIHLCVAKEVNKVLKVNEKEFYLSNIAPDIAKQIGMDKKETHFIDGFRINNNNPDLDLFLEKYLDNLNDPFVLGYYCHLFADLYYFGFYYLRYHIGNKLYYKDGHIECFTEEEIEKEIYKEYDYISKNLINKYNLDLSLFYEEAPNVKSNIVEFPLDDMQQLVDIMRIYIERSLDKPNNIFEEERIYEYIDFVSKLFIKHLKEIRVI